MASGAKQLSEDFEQVQKLLKSYPNIKIINTEGDPPEQYDIEYKIKGYVTEPDGNASPENKHQVRITLPFGYPHFPPTAKPITPIFHPDIDPDAIRIADFWQQNNSLPELIIHIGQMICGNHYTNEEPFNQAAFEWFEERKSWLPFDILEPGEEDEIEPEVETEDESQFELEVEPEDEADGDLAALSKEEEKIFKPSPDMELDILKDDLDFPFDDDEEIGASSDEIDFSPEEIPAESASEDQDDELDFGIDLESEDFSETFDLEESDESEPSLPEADDSADDISFDLNLEEEEPVKEIGGQEEAEEEVDSDDFASAFEVEPEQPEQSPDLDITLDDLASPESSEGELDFGIEEESFDLEDTGSVDLSGLEAFEDEEPAAATSGDDEEDILSSLSLDEESPSAGNIDGQDLAIRNLIEQKQIFTAKKALADHPDPDILPSKTEFEMTIADAIGEAEELFKKADQHEKKGEFEKAGILLDLVANLATDFPGLEVSRNKIRESMMGGGDKKTDQKEKAKAEETKEDTLIGQKEDTEEKPDKKKKKKPKAKLDFQLPQIPGKILIIIGVIILVGGIAGATAFLYMGDNGKIEQAQATVQKAEQNITKKNFSEAKKLLAETQTTLDGIVFFQTSQKEKILKQIDSISSSSAFREGLKGRVLYGDMYVTIETAKYIDKFNTHVNFAEQVLKDGKLEQAISSYEKAIPFAEKAGLSREQQTITRTIDELRLQLALDNAKQAEEKQEWLTAKDFYAQALDHSTKILPPEEQKDIAKKLASVTYHYGLQVGLKAINESQWQTAIDAFQEVKEVFKQHPQVVSETEQFEIDKLLAQAQLYDYLGKAKEAYDRQNWNQAISFYNNAVSLLKDKKDFFGNEGEQTILMIEKTILTTRVAEKQADVVQAYTNKQLSEVVDHYQSIVTLIENSAFSNDQALVKILDDARSKTVDLKNQLLVTTKEKWLKDNYENIFRENYPSARSSQFRNPKTHFIKRDGNVMIFNISCTEIKQGRKFRLELNYQNDLNTNKWSIFSGTIDEE